MILKFFFLFCAYCFAQPITILNLEKEPAKIKKKPELASKFSGPVLLDTRPAFEYSTGHYEKSVPIRWEDYAQTESPHKGALDPDSDLLARKLRVLGVMPGREVIVLGKGSQGNGEEGAATCQTGRARLSHPWPGLSGPRHRAILGTLAAILRRERLD